MHGSAKPDTAEIARFAGTTRAFHWAVAVPFLVLLATGLTLFVPSLKGINAGGYRLVPLVHVIAGLALLALVPAVLLLSPGRRAALSDLRRSLTLEADDGAWLSWAARSALGAAVREPSAGKYNAGQKLASLFWWLITGGLSLTGAVLAINFFSKRYLDPLFVERIYPWHSTLMWLSLPVLAGHLYFALVNPGTRPSLRGMISGRVSAAWAYRHHRRWVEEAGTGAPPEPVSAARESSL